MMLLKWQEVKNSDFLLNIAQTRQNEKGFTSKESVRTKKREERRKEKREGRKRE